MAQFPLNDQPSLILAQTRLYLSIQNVLAVNVSHIHAFLDNHLVILAKASLHGRQHRIVDVNAPLWPNFQIHLWQIGLTSDPRSQLLDEGGSDPLIARKVQADDTASAG